MECVTLKYQVQATQLTICLNNGVRDSVAGNDSVPVVQWWWCPAHQEARGRLCFTFYVLWRRAGLWEDMWKTRELSFEGK